MKKVDIFLFVCLVMTYSQSFCAQHQQCIRSNGHSQIKQVIIYSVMTNTTALQSYIQAQKIEQKNRKEEFKYARKQAENRCKIQKKDAYKHDAKPRPTYNHKR